MLENAPSLCVWHLSVSVSISKYWPMGWWISLTAVNCFFHVNIHRQYSHRHLSLFFCFSSPSQTLYKLDGEIKPLNVLCPYTIAFFSLKQNVFFPISLLGFLSSAFTSAGHRGGTEGTCRRNNICALDALFPRSNTKSSQQRWNNVLFSESVSDLLGTEGWLVETVI